MIALLQSISLTLQDFGPIDMNISGLKIAPNKNCRAMHWKSFHFACNRTEMLCWRFRKNGLNLKHAALELRRDIEIVQIAIENHAAVFAYCSQDCPIPERHSKKFVLRIFTKIAERNGRIYSNLNPLSEIYGSSLLNNNLPRKLKADREIVLEARSVACLSFSDIPEKLTKKRRFWLYAIARHVSFFFELPTEFRSDPSFLE